MCENKLLSVLLTLMHIFSTHSKRRGGSTWLLGSREKSKMTDEFKVDVY